MLVVLVVGAATLAIAGCGSNSSEGITVETGSLSKSEFIQRADTLCRAARSQFDRELAGLYQSSAAKASEEDPERLIRLAVKGIFLPTYERLIEEVSTIGAPSDDLEELESLLNQFQQRLDEIRATPSEASKTTTPLQAVEQSARVYGLDGCAESLS